MSNMGYCKFRNTLNDLKDCEDHFDDDLSEDENKARIRLLNLCKRIAANYVDEDDLPEKETEQA